MKITHIQSTNNDAIKIEGNDSGIFNPTEKSLKTRESIGKNNSNASLFFINGISRKHSIPNKCSNVILTMSEPSNRELILYIEKNNKDIRVTLIPGNSEKSTTTIKVKTNDTNKLSVSTYKWRSNNNSSIEVRKYKSYIEDKNVSINIDSDTCYLQKILHINSAKKEGSFLFNIVENIGIECAGKRLGEKTYEGGKGSLPFYLSKNAIVSGFSLTGLCASAILNYHGYNVTVYEPRNSYERNIQWSIRQSFHDFISYIDKNLALEIITDVSSNIPKGSIFTDDRNNTTKVKERYAPRDPDMKSIPRDARIMMSSKPVSLVCAKNIESKVRKHIEEFDGIKIIDKKLPELKIDNGVYFIDDDDKKPDLIIISEGASSNTRGILGIKTIQMSPNRKQVAGSICLPGEGVMSKHIRKVNSKYETNGLYITGLQGQEGFERTWVVGDISKESEIKIKNEENHEKKQELVNDEFLEIVSHSTGIDKKTLSMHKFYGATDRSQPRVFDMFQKLSDTAVKGSNVLLVGDAVGNGHWSVGGGMQVGTTCHGTRLIELLENIQNGLAKEYSLGIYNSRVQDDTEEWLFRGNSDFYLNTDEKESQDIFLKKLVDARNR